MSQTTEVIPELKFHGTPGRLEAFAPFSGASFGMPVSVDLEAKELSAPAILAVPVTPGILRLKLRISRSAPPGSYKGIVRVDGREFPFVALVEPEIHLAVSPRSLCFETGPNAIVGAEITVVNNGNAPCEVAAKYAFGLFPIDGLEDALGATYRAHNKDGRRWVDRLGDELAEEYGGLVRVRVKSGYGKLDPGAARNLALAFRMPRKLKGGRIYTGNLPIYNLRYFVKVQVPDSKAEPTQIP